MGLITDPEDPRLGKGVDAEPTPQHEVYLVLSDEERAKGFVRPLRRAYRHVGIAGPKYPVRPTTAKEREIWSSTYVQYEEYPDEVDGLGKFWTQEQLDRIDGGGGAETRMGLALCETYAREPRFYGATYCVNCSMHLPVAEFVWVEDGERVGS